MAENLQKLLMRLTYYKGAYAKMPQELIFEKLLELFKLNQEEHIRWEKFQVRVRRRTMAFFPQSKNQNRTVYRIENLKRDLFNKERKREDDLELKPFEVIYKKKMKQLQEQQTMQRSSVTEGDSILDELRR